MSKTTKNQKTKLAVRSTQADGFAEIVDLISAAKQTAYSAANAALIELYWKIGETISRRIEAAVWGTGVVPQLAAHIARHHPGQAGFTARNLFRMRQFYETYRDHPIVSPAVTQLSPGHTPSIVSALLTQLPWTHNLIILSQCKQSEEREFYLRAAIRSHWSSRELERQLRGATFERTMLSDLKLAPAVRVLPQDATGVFKDSYLVDFLDLPDKHSEADLQTGLLRNLRRFLMELGDGFAFVGEKVRVQVGNQDFELDLLFYHRDLQCLVAFELKTGRFEPEHMGKLAFYLEALDRDRKRPHENPSIGVLLCRTKDDEVVEYAMNRHLSPALVAQYETQMIPKTVLQQKLHEWSQMLQAPESADEDQL
jgi:predicted nuclease of restriction endonuclease-like (RecB) superfamily